MTEENTEEILQDEDIYTGTGTSVSRRTVTKRAISGDYRLRMIEKNRIEGLLPLSVDPLPGENILRYEISSRETLREYLETAMIGTEEIKILLYGIRSTFDRLTDYLLIESDLVLTSDCIYLDRKTFRPELMYLPGYSGDTSRELSDLMREILGGVDREDHEGVVLAYSLFRESKKTNYIFDDLIAILDRGTVPDVSESEAARLGIKINTPRSSEDTGEQGENNYIYSDPLGAASIEVNDPSKNSGRKKLFSSISELFDQKKPTVKINDRT